MAQEGNNKDHHQKILNSLMQFFSWCHAQDTKIYGNILLTNNKSPIRDIRPRVGPRPGFRTVGRVLQGLKFNVLRNVGLNHFIDYLP